MIIGVFLRNLKTYTGINYVPLTNGHSFSGLVGNNGIGKSSVLEALDSLLNEKDWNFNTVVKKSGLSTTNPHIVPIYLLSSDQISDKNKEKFSKISEYTWSIQEQDILSQNRVHFDEFRKQREDLKKSGLEQKILIPLGLSHDGVPNLSIFNTKKLASVLQIGTDETQLQDEELKELVELQTELKDIFEYIYIPKDIDLETFTQLETREIQSLMGETLNEIVAKCVPQQKIRDINDNLNKSIDDLSSILGDYTFRTSGERQVNLRKHDVYKLIIDAYFRLRKLHKKEGNYWLELNILSSGEKQKAIIELAFQLLENYRKKTDDLIIAVDEPESSLHMSACYDQFNKLFDISTHCSQLLFTTHWYGFLPTVENGYVTFISKVKDQHRFDLIDISRYRESIKQTISNSSGTLPFDIRLKSLNDFVQSIITSILSDEPYNWLICEGSSDKIYFENYFKHIKKEKKLRIIPVGGAGEIKRIYNNLQVAYEDFKSEVKGKVIVTTQA